MTAPPVEANLVVPKGATWRRVWTLTDPDTELPIDLTAGYTAKGQIRAWYGAETTLHEWDSSGSNLVLRANGEVEVTVTATESSAWDWWEGVYDIELTGPSGEPIRIAAGTIAVSPEVTQ